MSLLSLEYENNLSEHSDSETSPNSSRNSLKDLLPIAKICEAKFSIYLVSVPSKESQYAMKVFPFSDSDKPSRCFVNNIRFSQFKHRNIITPFSYNPQKKFSIKGKNFKASYTLMEYAPYGDFHGLIINHPNVMDEILARTYFHQLIEGLEYLHSHEISHLDLKLENLLIGKDFILKIIDFDTSNVEGDSKIYSMGTRCYRAPELLTRTIKNPKAADIFSAGIILFVLKSGGTFPQTEDECIDGVNLYDLSQDHNKIFWFKHCSLQNKDSSFFDEDFKELFNWMTKADPEERPTIKDIKKSNWYMKSILSDEELKTLMSSYVETEDI